METVFVAGSLLVVIILAYAAGKEREQEIAKRR